MNELAKIFNTLVMYDYNVRVLHWKVIGKDFDTKHKLMDDYHAQLNTMTDEIGEIILMLHGTLPSFHEVDNTAMNDRDEKYTMLSGSDVYDGKQVLEYTRRMFNQLIGFYEKALETELPSDIKSKLDEHLYWLRLETGYKLDSQLND